MEVLRQISRMIDLVNGRIGQAVAWLTLAIVGLGAISAIGRYLAKWIKLDMTSNDTLNLNTLIELQWQLFAVIFLLGASYTLRENGHVRVDVLYDRLTARQRVLVNLIGHALLLLPFCIFMMWISFPWAIQAWRIWENSPDPGGLPLYPIKTVLPVAFVFLFLQGVSEIIKQVEALNAPEPTAGGPSAEKPEPEEGL